MALKDSATAGAAKGPTWLGRPANQFIDQAAGELATIKNELRAGLSLRPGQWVLDVGCGTGVDVLEMAGVVGPRGRVVGVDISAEAAEEARRRAAAAGSRAEFLVAGAHELPFPSGSFDACRAERMLQHVADPARAIAEMLRVTKPGGRIVVVDPDHGMWAPDVADRELARTLLTWWFDHIHNPWSGRGLANLFRAAGAREVRIEVVPLVLTDLDRADALTGLLGAAQVAHGQGVITAEQASRWHDDLVRRDAEGRFVMLGAMVAVHVTKSLQ